MDFGGDDSPRLFVRREKEVYMHIEGFYRKNEEMCIVLSRWFCYNVGSMVFGAHGGARGMGIPLRLD